MPKANDPLPIYPLKLKIACHGTRRHCPYIGTQSDYSRVEKYRPNTLEDVSGHQDILATINKFVDSNVRRKPKQHGLLALTLG